MALDQFNKLPTEIRMKVFSFCSKKELKNVTLVSKQCNGEVQPFLWASIKLSWQRLEDFNDVEKYKSQLHHAKQLEFEDTRLYSVRCEESMEQGYKSFAFQNILRCCNPEKLKRLALRLFLVAGGLRLASEMLPQIMDLTLVGIQADDRDWRCIYNFPYLVRLEISGSVIYDDYFENIGDIKTLRVLDIRHCDGLNGSCLGYLNQIAGPLTLLRFTCFFEIASPDYVNLTDLRNVETLDLQDTQVDDTFFVQLHGKLKHLEVLNLRCTKVTDLAIHAISLFESLQDLCIQYCRIGDQGMEYLLDLPNLTSLDAAGCEGITDLGMVHISKMKELLTLDVGGAAITDQGIVHIESLQSLTWLDIYDCNNLTDTSLELISKKLLLLKHIDVSCDKFTKDGLYHLLPLTHLNDFNYDVDSGEINDEDVEDFFSAWRARRKDRLHSVEEDVEV